MAAVAGVTGSSRSAACCAVLLAAVLFLSAPATTEAYDSLDPYGNITIKWDIISWTPDGYVATVTITNYQQFRTISAPGWRLGWSWRKKEVMAMVGARAIKRGDCSKFKRSRPHCCKRDPTIVDLPSGTPFNQQVANCCKAGVLKTFNQDPGNAASSFQIAVGLAGTTNRTVILPKKITLKAPGQGYTCGRALVVVPTKYSSSGGRRVTQAFRLVNGVRPLKREVICS
ncbi:hypothetical protein CFC21_073574 [Triticum aestivum]|uniref:COBRA-like protein n=3 Tax=Triticum TaxID=4564 RepID=A0A9R0XHZ5_TRITD|nr:hypothetical protein CFC21_073574 [Triticum aestivum]VAI36854.1 unnamed protein product [Triticum turgidum subsp. durum]